QTWNSNPQLTHGEARLCAAIYLGFNYKHWEEFGQLLSWPGWLTLENDTTLSERSIARNFVKLERLGAIKILHGGFDSKTGQHRPNKYLAILDTVHLTPESGGHLNPPDSGGKKPSDSGVRRLGDKEDSVNLKKENQDFFGLPREERKQKTGEDFL